MAQFQVYANKRDSHTLIPYLLDVQSDAIDLATRLVVPLVIDSAFGPPLTRINPVFEIAGRELVMSAADLAGVPKRDMGEWVADVSAARGDIIGALDFLLTGV